MKRYGNLYEQVYDMENLIQAHKNASRGKGWYNEVIEVNKFPSEYLRILQGMLIYKNYETSEYEVFNRKDGKKTRVISKLPYFPDRICQWALMQVIEPILIRNFVRDTYSAIPGRGLHIAVKRIQDALKNDPKGTVYCLKMDIKKFYPSINHRILKRKFRKIFKDPDILWLIDEIIDSTPEDEGIPIGNYLSQYCGNFYLSDFDHWIKETKFFYKEKYIGIVYYFRYMDDMIILSGDKEFLHWLRRKISEYLENEDLHLKQNWQVFPVKDRGIDFIGYRIFPEYTLLRKDTVKTMKKSLNRILVKVTNGGEFTYHDFCCVHSYMGWLKPCDGYRLAMKYIEPLMIYANNYYIHHLANQDREEKRRMKKFLNVESTIEKPQFWTDELFVYVLLKQDEIKIHEGQDDEVPGWLSDYTQYTKAEWQDLITQDLKEKTIIQLDQSLETVKANKIAESKVLLEQYYKDNPLFSTVHKAVGEYYAVTSDKQSYLSLMITLCEQAEELGQQFTPTWNATGESCEPWTKTELKQLALQIASFVYPAVSKQQSYEKIINSMTTVKKVQELEITYA